MTPEVLPQRVFFLGAGFSVPAGLPMADELLRLVLAEVGRFQPDSHLHSAVEEYQDFVEATTGSRPTLEEIDIEAFVEYLDHEHFFGFLGSDTFSEEGNQPQLLLRWGIGRVLHEATPDALPEVYLRFADGLRGGDIVTTFNYDLILEKALEAVGLPFRRFPQRFTEVFPTHSVVDSERDGAEVCVLKLHGSLDWINRGRYDDTLAYMRATAGVDGERLHAERDPVFGPNALITTHALVDGPRPEADPLNRIAVVDSLDVYYSDYGMWWRYPPVLLAPSHAKQLYGQPLRGFWEGMPTGAPLWGGLSIIGCSLPRADPYTKQALYRVGRGFAYAREHPEERLWPMNRIKVVNFARDRAAANDLLERYRFLPADHTDFLLDGFAEDVLDDLFASDA